MASKFRWNDGGALEYWGNIHSVRNLFTALFMAVNLAIGFIGGRLLIRSDHHRLLTHRKVPITNLAPWLPLSAIFTYFWSVRRLPGGKFGYLMIANGVFATTNHYFINSFITEDFRLAECSFDHGIVATANGDPFSPNPNWAPAASAFRAYAFAEQSQVSSNSIDCGNSGVYSKVPSDATGFCPTEKDILGHWDCSPKADSIITVADAASYDAMETWTKQQNFLYDNVNASYWSGSWDEGSLVAWSASLPSNSTKMESLRVILANPIAENRPTTASKFECELIVTKANWTPTPIMWNTTLEAWEDTMLGYIQEYTPAYYGGQLEMVLNVISMVAGSGNSHEWDVDDAVRLGVSEDGEDDKSYGCLKYTTMVSPAVSVLFLVILLLLIVLTAIDIFNLIRNKMDKGSKVVERMPIDLASWQIVTAQQLAGGSRIKGRELHRYEYCMEGEELKCRAMLKENEPMSYQLIENPQSSPAANAVFQSKEASIGSMEAQRDV